MAPTPRKMHELCDITSSKRIYAADYKAEGVPFYRGKEISEKHRGNLDVSTELFIDRSKFEQIRAKFGAPETGDLLLTSVGTLGSPYVVEDGEEFYFKDGNLTWFRNFKNLDSRFLYYWFLSPQGKAELKKCTIGSSQSAYTIVLLKEMEIYLLDLATQRKIAAILSVYDDLIENNLRRIMILEEMAQNLYREWFVKFRFPVHQRTRFTDSPLGRIPEGWEAVTLGNYCELVMGQSPKSEFYNEDGVGLPFHQGVTGFGDRFPTDTVYCTITERIAEEGDILFSVRAPVGRINIALHRLVIGRGVAAIRACDRHQSFLLHQLKEVFSEDDLIGNGAIFKAVTKSDLMGVKLVKPASSIIAEFNGIAHNIGMQIKILTAKNTALRRTRDMLLPRLISGKVDVSELDIAVPEEAVA